MRALKVASLVLVLCYCGCSRNPPAPVVRPISNTYTYSDSTTYAVYNEYPVKASLLVEAVYQMMEDCLGQDGDFRSVDWAMASAIIRGDGLPNRGLWVPLANGRRKIVIASPWEYDLDTVSHEVIHDITKNPNHPEGAFSCVLGQG